MAKKKVTTSMLRMPTSPISGNIMPANSGASTPGPASISDINPLARLYCSLGTMVLMAAE